MPMNSITHFSESQTKGNRPDYKILFLLGFGHLAVDMNQGALPVLLPRLFVAYDLSYSLIGVIMLVFTMGSSLIQPLFGYYSDKKGALWLLPVSIWLPVWHGHDGIGPKLFNSLATGQWYWCGGFSS